MIYENWHGKHSGRNLILYIVQTKMETTSDAEEYAFFKKKST
jgi:hypothetical protein